MFRLLVFSGEHNDKKLQRQLLDINDGLLQDILSVLSHFDSTTRLLSADKEPTIHLVILVKRQLERNLAIGIEDSPIISLLKRRLHNMLEKYFPVQPFHMMATLLDPNIKDIGMTAEQKLIALDQLKKVIATESGNAASSENESVASAATSNAANTKPSEPKKLKTEILKAIINRPRQSVNEMETYLSTSISENAEEDADILHFWQQKSMKWPKLASVARKYLGVPATSTPSEWSFSIAGLTISDRRSQLSLDTVDDLLFLHRLPKQR